MKKLSILLFVALMSLLMVAAVSAGGNGVYMNGNCDLVDDVLVIKDSPCLPPPPVHKAVVCYVNGDIQETMLVPIYIAKSIIQEYPGSWWGECPEGTGGGDGGSSGGSVERTAAPVPYNPPGANITAWSVGGGDSGFIWEYDGNWVVDSNGDRIVTGVEWRNRFNSAVGSNENTSMTRLPLAAGGDTDPTQWQAFDALTGDPIGVWYEYEDEWCQSLNVCGVSDFRG